MSSSGLPARAGTRQLLAYSLLVLLTLAVLTLPAMLAALVAWFATRRHLRRRDWSILFIGSLLGTALLAPDTVGDMMAWWFSRVKLGSQPLWPFPFLGTVLLATLYTSLTGLVAGSSMAVKMTQSTATVAKLFLNPFSEESLIPSADKKQRVKVAAPPGGVVAGETRVHDIDSPAEIGKRQFALGLDGKGRPVFLNEGEIGMHGMILGSTGSGKTETIKALAGALMDLGWPGLILDLKEDTSTGGLRDFLEQYSASHTLPFQQLALSDPTPSFWFNPLQGMGPDEARDTILSLSEFDDQYWQNINKKMLGQLVNLCFEAHAADPTQVPYPTVYEIGRILGSGNLNQATKKLRGIVVSRFGAQEDSRFSALATPSPDEAKSATGFGAKLTQMFDTVAGRTVLRPDPGSARPLLDVTASGLTYVGLDTQGKPDLSSIVSSAVLQRMSVYAAQRTTGAVAKTTARFLIIDEANLINRDIVKNILARARSAGIVCFLCTQSPEDWIDGKRDDWSVMSQNINVAIIMAQGSPTSAELCAEFIGEKKKLQVMQRTEFGEWGSGASLRQDVDYVVPPHELRALGIGEAILRVNKPAERYAWMTIARRDPHAHAR